MNLFLESNIQVFRKAYLPDYNYPARKFLLEIQPYQDLISTGDKTSETIEQEFDSHKQINEFINQLVKNSLNLYHIWSDNKLLLSSFKKNDYISKKDIKTLDPNLKNYDPKSKLNTKIFLNSTCTRLTHVSLTNMHQTVFKLTPEAIQDISRVRDLDSANEFLNAYGFAYPLTFFESKKYHIKSIAVSSYLITDPIALATIARNTMLKFESNALPLNKNVLYENVNKNPKNPSDKFDYRIEIYQNFLPEIYQCQKCSVNADIYWMPVWKVIKNSANADKISLNSFNYIRDCWLFRDTNYYFLRKMFSCESLLESFKNNTFFNFEKYWFTSVFPYMFEMYKKNLHDNFYSRNLFPTTYEDDCIQNLVEYQIAPLMAREFRAIKLLFSENCFTFLAPENSPDELYDKTQRFNISYVCIYYSQGLITANPNLWLKILEKAKNYILIRNEFNNPGRKCPTIGLLIDYDLHGYLNAKPYFKKIIHIEDDFYNRNQGSFKIYQINDRVRSLDLSGQNRLCLNDLKNLENYFINLNLSRNLFFMLNSFSFPLGLGEKLLELNLNENQIDFIDQSAFLRMNNLVYLNLSHNSIERLNKGIFDSLIQLEELILGNNQINFIDPGVFGKLRRLKKLNLSHNQIESVSKNLFDSNENLEELNLGNNKITLLESNNFSKLAKLKILYLNLNKIEYLSKEQFNGLTNLEILFLNSNKIQSIKKEAFFQLVNLKVIFLFDNFFKNYHFKSIFNENIRPNELIYLYKRDQMQNCVKSIQKYLNSFDFE